MDMFVLSCMKKERNHYYMLLLVWVTLVELHSGPILCGLSFGIPLLAGLPEAGPRSLVTEPFYWISGHYKDSGCGWA